MFRPVMPAFVVSLVLSSGLTHALYMQRVVDTDTLMPGRSSEFVSFLDAAPLSIDNGTISFFGHSDAFELGLYKVDLGGNISVVDDGSSGQAAMSIQIRDGEVVYRRGNGVYLHDGSGSRLIADANTPVDLPGGGSGRVSYPRDVALGPQGVAFTGNSSLGTAPGLYLADGGGVREVVAAGSGASSPFLTADGAYYLARDAGIDALQFVDPTSGAITTLVDNSTPIPGGTEHFEYLSDLSARNGGLGFLGTSVTGWRGAYTMGAGDSTVQVIADPDTDRPDGGTFGGISQVAFGEINDTGNTELLFVDAYFDSDQGAEIKTLYHAAMNSGEAFFTPLLTTGDILADGTEIHDLQLSADGYDGRYGAVTAILDENSTSSAIFRFNTGDLAQLPARGFTAETLILHEDYLSEDGVKLDTHRTSARALVDDMQRADAQQRLQPIYNFSDGAVADATFAENHAIAHAQAYEQEIAFQPGAYGPIVKARSAAQWEVAYRADLDETQTRGDYFSRVEAEATAASYYRIQATGPDVEVGDDATVGMSFVFDGGMVSDSAQSDVGHPDGMVELVINVWANRRSHEVFQGVAHVGRLGAIVYGDDEFMLTEVRNDPLRREFNVNVSRAIADVFDGTTELAVGDLVWVSVTLTTSVDGVGGKTGRGWDDVEVRDYLQNEGVVDFFNTFQGTLVSSTPGVDLVLVDENGDPVTFGVGVSLPAPLALLWIGLLAWNIMPGGLFDNLGRNSNDRVRR